MTRLGDLRTKLGRPHWNQRTSIGVALFLLGVPTAFSIFPTWSSWDWRTRTVVLVAWVALAVVVVAAQANREQVIDKLASDTGAGRRDLRRASVLFVLAAMLRRGTEGLPEGYEFTVYVKDGDLLRPVFPEPELRPGEHDLRIFKVDDGATGSAWARRRTFVVTGDKVHNARHGLSEEQQEAFKDFRTVAATPIDFMGERLGVLTVLSREDDGYFNDGRPGRFVLERLADIVGVVLKSIPTRSDLRAPDPAVTPRS